MMSDSPWETVKKILLNRGLTEPDGRILCLYRITEDEYELLKQSIVNDPQVSHYQVGDSQGIARAFCLYAAEWWRKNHDGGHWAWYGVLESLGIDPHLPRPKIYSLVLAGLHFWNRQILRVGSSRAFLVTLACEGGLPLNLIHQEGASLRNYFEALLREFQVYGLRGEEPAKVAARVAGHLSISLQQEIVYQLCGNLVEKIWELQARLGETETPIKDLDRIDPNWRDKLPLVVSDKTARILLNNLVEKAALIAGHKTKDIKVETSLIEMGELFELRRRIRLPPSLSASDLENLLGVPQRALPFRFQLYLRFIDGTERLLALVTRRTSGDDGLFALEIATDQSEVIKGNWACQRVRLVGKTNNMEFLGHDLRGGNGLAELPWVFVDRKGEGLELVFAGEGSVRTRYPEAYVLIPDGMRVNPRQDGEAVILGVIQNTKRSLCRISGIVSFHFDGNISTVRTRSTQDENFQYVLQGKFFTAGIVDTEVYRGLPQIQCYLESGILKTIQLSEIEWKVQGTDTDWFAMSEDCIGPVVLKHAPEGEVRFITRVQTIPHTSQVLFSPGSDGRSGEINLQGFSNPEVGLLNQDGLSVEIDQNSVEDTATLKLTSQGEPPSLIKLKLRWAHNQEIGLDLPYPAQGGRFFRRDGKVCQDKEMIHIERVGGHKAQVLVPYSHNKFFIEAVLKARDISFELQGSLWAQEKLVELSPGRHEIDLFTLQEACILLFSMTEDLDAYIDIFLMTEDKQHLSKQLKIARYEAGLTRNDATGEIVIPETDLVGLNPGVCENIKVWTFPMWNPMEESDELTRTGSIQWDFDSDRREPGPWLVTGWHGDFCNLRPYCWIVEKPENGHADDAENDHVEGSVGPISLEQAVKLNDLKQRIEACDELIENLSNEPDALDWESVDGYIDLLTHLPATTFDVIDRLIRNSRAVAMALLRAKEDRFDSVWTNLEKLPFMWELVPVQSWLEAADLIYQNAKKSLITLGLEIEEDQIESMVKSLLEVFVKQAPLRVPGMNCLTELIEGQFLGRAHNDTQYLGLASSGQWEESLCTVILEEAKQTLLQSHAEDHWPQGENLQNRIMERVDLPRSIVELLITPLRGLGYRSAVISTPIMSALGSAYGIQLSREMIFSIRKVQQFDPHWFDTAYGCALVTAIGHLIRTGELRE